MCLTKVNGGPKSSHLVEERTRAAALPMIFQSRHVLGQAIRIRSPYVDALSVTQVLALKSLRKKVDKEELTHGQKENYTYLILCTVSGVAAGLQNTG